MPKQFPAQYGRSPLYRNPEHTLPMPAASDIPVPQWYTPWMRIDWALDRTVDPSLADPGVAYPPGGVYTYTWTTPNFDLRPDLRSGNAGPKQGVPIWTPSARLFVQLASQGGQPGIQILQTPNLTVTATEWVSLAFNQTQALGGTGQSFTGLKQQPSYDVTSKFAVPPGNLGSSTVGGFAPVGSNLGGGEGYPVRFWRLQLEFEIAVETAVPLPSPLTLPANYILQASMY